MPENSSIYYTDRALVHLVAIRDFILLKFTQKEVQNFYKLLRKFEKTVSAFPEIYPKSILDHDTFRAVLSKQLSVFYEINEDVVSVTAILDNRMDYDKWPS